MKIDGARANDVLSTLFSSSMRVRRWAVAALTAYAANAVAEEALPAGASTPEEHPPLARSAEAAPEKDYALPAWEIVGFEVLVNRFNRFAGDQRDDYKVTTDSIRRNLHSSWGTDKDPFQINQLGHPYQGAMYHGFARSAGFDYWQSFGYTFAGSALWEIAGENTHPSRNDQIASGGGGSFLGEALFRMANLVLEQGGGLPRFWREVAATAIAPSAGFNRLAFGGRFDRVFSSRNAAYYSRLQIGYSGNVKRDFDPSSADFRRNEAQIDFALDYGLPGNPGYDYTRPFDYFNFQATASSANKLENVMTRGLLVGRSYEAGDTYRGVWGLYGSYDYIAPQTYRVSTTALSLGTTAQWWLGQTLSLQGTAMTGLGYAAVGTTDGAVGARDYNYGVAPAALLALRLTDNDKYSIDLTAREYFVSDVASGTSGGHDNIIRGEASLSWRIAKRRAITFKLLGNRRDARFTPLGSSRQTQVTAGIFYSFIGQDRFGVIDWR